MTQTFKTIIIGKGMMGSAAAKYVAAEQDGVALVGPDEPVQIKAHQGVFASHYDEARITRIMDADPVWAELAARSIQRYCSIESRTNLSFYTEVGCLFAGTSLEAHGHYLGRTLAVADAMKLDLQQMDEAGLAANFDGFSFPRHASGWLERTRAGHINPRMLVRAQSDLAAMGGATLVPHAVTSVRDEGNRVRVTTADGEDLLADQVLVAAGGFSNFDSLLPRPVAMRVAGMTVVFYEMDQQALAIYQSMPSVVMFAERMEDLVYILPPVRYPDGRTYLKVGNDVEAKHFIDRDRIGDWFRSDGDAGEREHINRIATGLMPGLQNLPVTSAACVASFTRSSYPYIGFTQSPRIGVLTGGNFVAAKCSDELGRLGARLMLDGALGADDFGELFTPQFV